MLSPEFKLLFLWKSNMRCTLCTAMPQTASTLLIFFAKLLEEKTKHASRDKRGRRKTEKKNKRLLTLLFSLGTTKLSR